MQNIYLVAFTFITSNAILSSLEATPVPNPVNSIYDVLVDISSKKCPYLKTTKLLQSKPSFLDSCSDYSQVQSITSLTRKSAYDASCLLFMNNFVSLCNLSIDFAKLINNSLIDEELKSYNLTSVCTILQKTKVGEIFKNSENVVVQLKKPDVCSKICSEIINEGVTPICSLAAYSLRLENIIQVKAASANLNKGDKGSNSPDLHATAVEGAAQKPPPKPQVQKPLQAVNSESVSAHAQNQPPSEKVIEKGVEAAPKEHTNDANKSPQQPPGPNGEQPNKVHIDNEPKKTEIAQEEPKKEVKPDDASINKGKEGSVEKKDDTENAEMANIKPVVEEPKVEPPKDTEKKTIVEQEPPKDVSAEKKKTVEEPPPVVPDNLDGEISNQEIQNEEDGDANVDDNNEPIDDIKPPTNSDEASKGKDKKTNAKPDRTAKDSVSGFDNPNVDEENSLFFIYFMMVCAVFILGYIGYHNKQKVLALVIEGRRGKRGSRRGRPNSANYHKLDSNLEEAVTSSCNKNTTNIIY